MENTYQFIYQSQNIGDLTVTHASRNDKGATDTFIIVDEKGKQLSSIELSHSIKPANAMRLMDSVLEGLDYKM